MSPRCAKPLDGRALVDYWFEELRAPELDPIEEHLLECAECSLNLSELVALGDGVRRRAHQGAFQVVVSPAFLETAGRRGLRIREYSVPPDGRVACTVRLEDDLLISRLQGDFSGVTRLDLVALTEGHPEERFEGLPVDPAAPELIIAQAMPAMRALGNALIRLRLVVPEPTGDRVLGEYTFAHTRSGE